MITDVLRALISSFVGTLGFALLLHTPRRAILPASLIGMFAYLLYWVLLHSLIDVGSHLTAQERKTPRMQQAREYERRARRALRQEHAVTPQALGNTLCFILSQDRYFETRWKNRT